MTVLIDHDPHFLSLSPSRGSVGSPRGSHQLDAFGTEDSGPRQFVSVGIESDGTAAYDTVDDHTSSTA